jgi:predicted Zn-dependent protease with MMP-like domain
VSKQRFAKLVEEALTDLPGAFTEYLEEVVVEVRDRPSIKQLKEAGLGRDDLLLGLYVGRPLTERSVEQSGGMPDVVYIFQEDIELVSETEEKLLDQIRTTVLHEIGHHFGMDEDDLDEVGFG